jgi:hypothetical protein
MSTFEPPSAKSPEPENDVSGKNPPAEGHEPQVERAETLHLPLRNWVFLWAVPVVVVVVVLVVLITITNP